MACKVTIFRSWGRPLLRLASKATEFFKDFARGPGSAPGGRYFD
jgi:hypothetical protein